MSELQIIQEEVTRELANKETANLLLATTFKGLQANVMPQAIMEGMLRGYDFKSFLEKDVYAVPFNQGAAYSLVTSIDRARKIGMRSGVIEKGEPVYAYTDKDGRQAIEKCSVTIKRRIGNDIGSFAATVYFEEYYRPGRTYSDRSTGKSQYTPSLWDTKPHTMIAKVAEMHALRMACPEELSKDYIEDEISENRPIITAKTEPSFDIEECKQKMTETKDLDQLKEVWIKLPQEARDNKELAILKEDLKLKFDPNH